MTHGSPRPRVSAAAAVALALALAADRRAAADEVEPLYEQDYTFTSDWFTNRIPTWKRVLEPYAGREDLAYLEVGLFQGRSALWMLENVVSHPTSRMTGVDIQINPHLRANLEKSGAADRVTLLEGPSQRVLKEMPEESFDVVYIDGSHRGDDVLTDAVLAWRLLRDGGVLIFDDYVYEAGLPLELRPKLAIDAFVSLHRSRIDVVSRSIQLIVRKRPSPCAPGSERFCMALGDFAYEWKTRELVDPGVGPVELTDAERHIVERLLKRIPLGHAAVTPQAALAARPAYRSLLKKLGRERLFGPRRAGSGS